MHINKEIFRTYDIRGNSLKDLTEDIAYKIGFCFAKMTTNTSNKKICVGLDGRLSSPTLFDALECGLAAGGAETLNLGIVPTPVLYFADKEFKPSASIMVTGSHNPRDDNGFKLLQNSKPFFGSQIQDLLAKILDTDWQKRSNYKNTHKINITHKYLECILNRISGIISKFPYTNGSERDMELQSTTHINLRENLRSRSICKLPPEVKFRKKFNINLKLKVAWDCGNGATGNIIEDLKHYLDNKNIIINSKIDGNFPSHHPDPTNPANLQELIKLVKEQNCDIGIAFDGDGDRLGIVSSSGKILFGDQILCIFAKDILKKNPNATIIVDVKASQLIVDRIKLYGGRPIICRTGHPFIKNKITETKALLAGEMSGHIFFADKYFGFDDAIYAALRFLDLLSRSNKNLETIIEELPKSYSTPEIKIFVTSEVKLRIIKEIKERLLKSKIEFNDIDGIRVNSTHGWWLLRSSNTESAIIARAESVSNEGLIELKTIINKLLSKYGLTIN